MGLPWCFRGASRGGTCGRGAGGGGSSQGSPHPAPRTLHPGKLLGNPLGGEKPAPAEGGALRGHSYHAEALDPRVRGSDLVIKRINR